MNLLKMLNYKKEIISFIIALFTFAGLIWGFQSYLFNTFALAQDLEQTEKRFEVHILEDKLLNIQKRIWNLEDRYEKKQIPPDRKLELKELEQDKLKLEKKLDRLYLNKD